MAYSTFDEIRFIIGMGEFSIIPRLELLQQYKKSLKYRADWGTIDELKISQFLDDEIEKEMEKKEEPTDSSRERSRCGPSKERYFAM